MFMAYLKYSLIIKQSSFYENIFLYFNVQSNLVITNSSGPTRCVRYNRVDLCTKWSLMTENFVRYNRVFVITEFVITGFHCI